MINKLYTVVGVPNDLELAGAGEMVHAVVCATSNETAEDTAIDLWQVPKNYYTLTTTFIGTAAETIQDRSIISAHSVLTSHCDD